MTRVIYFITFFIAFCGFQGCHNGADLPLLDEADSLMFIDPQKSLIILDSIKDISHYHKSDVARYALLLSQSRSRNRVVPDNDSIIKIAINYYSHNNNLKLRAWTFIVASDVYDELNNDSLALYYAREALKLSKIINDEQLKYYANYFMGYMLRYQRPFDDGDYYFHKALIHAKELGDTSHIITSLIELGSNAVFRDRTDEAISYFHQIIPYCKSSKSHKYKSYVYARLASNYAIEDDFQNAIIYIDRSIENIDSTSNLVRPEAIYALKADILAYMKDWDSIPYFAEMGIRDTTFYTLMMYDATMMKYAEGKGNYKDALQYSKHYMQMVDSINEEDSKNKMMELQRKFDASEAEAENEALENKVLRGNVTTAVFVVICMVMLVVILFYRRKIKEVQREREKAKEDLTLLAMKMMNDRNRHLLADEHRRHRLLALNSVIAKVMSTSRKDNAERIRLSDKAILSGEETMQLVEAVDLCYEGFIAHLGKTYSLPADDITLCCMLLLKVKNRDISILMGLTPDALKKRKMRLQKDKLGTDEKLDDWLERESREHVEAVDAEYAKPAPDGETETTADTADSPYSAPDEPDQHQAPAEQPVQE